MATYHRKITLNLISICLLMVGTSLFASGQGEEPIDSYVSRDRPDIDLDAYQSGDLGIVLPYPRIFLYPAWRAIMMGRADLQKESVIPGKLQKFCCDYVSGWVEDRDSKSPQAKWAVIRSTVTSELQNVRLSLVTQDNKSPYRYFSSCTNASYSFAAATLVALKKRADATPECLKE